MSKTMSTSGPKAPGGVPVPKTKRGMKGFLKEVSREVKKVSWPDTPETNRLTGIVLAVCGLIVLILSALSFVIDTVINNILLKGSGA